MLEGKELAESDASCCRRFRFGVTFTKDEPVMFKKIGKIGIGVATLGAVSLGVYLRLIRPWQLRWGATDEEVAPAMPGDDVVKSPTFNATRGVTVQARPEEIWPWLVQMGVTRAG